MLYKALLLVSINYSLMCNVIFWIWTGFEMSHYKMPFGNGKQKIQNNCISSTWHRKFIISIHICCKSNERSIDWFWKTASKHLCRDCVHYSSWKGNSVPSGNLLEPTLTKALWKKKFNISLWKMGIFIMNRIKAFIVQIPAFPLNCRLIQAVY